MMQPYDGSAAVSISASASNNAALTLRGGTNYTSAQTYDGSVARTMEIPYHNFYVQSHSHLKHTYTDINHGGLVIGKNITVGYTSGLLPQMVYFSRVLTYVATISIGSNWAVPNSSFTFSLTARDTALVVTLGTNVEFTSLGIEARLVDNGGVGTIMDKTSIVYNASQTGLVGGFVSAQFIASGLTIGTTYSFSLQFLKTTVIGEGAAHIKIGSGYGATFISAKTLPNLTIVSSNPSGAGGGE